MIKYTFGVMSSKFELEADNETVAKISMCLFFGKPIPIAIYSPENIGVIIPLKILEQNKNKIQEIADKIKECLQTIKEV